MQVSEAGPSRHSATVEREPDEMKHLSRTGQRRMQTEG